MRKNQLRNKTLKQLKSVSYDHRQQIESKLYHHLFSTPFWKQAQSIGITISQDFEWNTVPIIEEGWKQNKNIS
ncbi:5-formyltetrahydrofolate cyclo-ligase, partial [Salmonella enterica]|uniref:5-formyltetrahydrofolate cyclo-ligase n=1 Tax=Salmonella enterica TaxID=28901 RepID=UPI003CF3BAD3